MKRMIDITGSFFLLLLLSPMIIFISLLIYFNMGSPIIFKQFRPGLNGRPIKIYKFRTMNNWVDHNGKQLPGELRLTTLGKWLRKYSFDELPQLYNVLKGDMSLVGPRPLLMEYLKKYSEEQARRHDVKPGITGWAQVNGRNSIVWEEKFELDIWYVDNHTTLLDIKILFITLIKVIKTEGVSSKNHYSMERFNEKNNP